MPYPFFVLVSFAIAAVTVGAAAANMSRRASVAVAFGGATALLLVHALGFFRFFADDSFITFRYARNLADGLGPNWNDSGHVEGYTNFSWMLIMAGFSKAGADLVVTSQVLGMLAMLATLATLYLIWQRWSEDAPGSGIESPVVIAAVFAGIALTGAVPFWGFSGMETPLFTLLLTLGACRFFIESRKADALPVSAAILALAALTRPEGLIAVAVTGAFVLANGVDRERGAIDLRRPLAWAATFALFYVPYFAWRYAYYDYLLPNTFYAKVDPNSELFNRGIDYVWSYGQRFLLLPLLLGGALLLTRQGLRRDASYVLVLTATFLAAVIAEGGEKFPHGRLLVPVLPLVYVAGISGLAMALRAFFHEARQRALFATLALVLAALALLRGSNDLLVPITRERDALAEREALGRWLDATAPEDYTIAAFAVGAIGYYTTQDVLDMLGLNDTTIAHTEVPGLGSGLGGHEKYNIDYVLDTVRPEIIVINDGEPAALTEDELREQVKVRSPVPARNRLFADERLWDRYDVVSIEIDGAWFNLLQRADTLGN